MKIRQDKGGLRKNQRIKEMQDRRRMTGQQKRLMKLIGCRDETVFYKLTVFQEDNETGKKRQRHDDIAGGF